MPQPVPPGYGPEPSPDRPLPHLSAARSAVLRTLREHGEPVGLSTLAELCGLHTNTVREHLDALVKEGLVGRQASAPAGRGRPALLYRATGPGSSSTTSVEYAGLAAALAAALRQHSASPAEDAVAAGREWGRRLARARHTTPAGTSAAARRRLVALLDEAGFAPRPDAHGSHVRLTRCPLLDAAREHPQIVCGVHLGLAQGALSELGADPSGTDLLPFAERGACTLRLGPRRAR